MDKNANSKMNCDECYKIICKICKWEASEKELEDIRSGVLENCPVCGWSPRVSWNMWISVFTSQTISNCYISIKLYHLKLKRMHI